jgi:hypothetical protein
MMKKERGTAGSLVQKVLSSRIPIVAGFHHVAAIDFFAHS